MTTPDHRNDPFTPSDEAFFQAGLGPSRELPSERPVTLDADAALVEPPAQVAAREARRARFVRPVRSTLVALSVLAAAGLLRHVLHSDSAGLVARAPALAPPAADRPAAPGLAANVNLTPSNDVVDAAPGLALSMCDGAASVMPLGDTPAPDALEAPLIGPPAPAIMTPPARASHHAVERAKTKPLTRPARPSRTPHRTAPIGKAALLHALRSS